MAWHVTRAAAPLPSLAVRFLGGASPDAFHDAYLLTEAGTPRWQALVHWGEHGHVPFREACLWPNTGVVALGGGAEVYFLRTSDGEPCRRLDVADLFGHLALDPGEPGVRDETLYVLGWSDAYAIGVDLRPRWHQPHIAVDGLCFVGATGTTITLSAEMDPPGGWFDVELDATTGRELARRPNFLEGYVGIDR